MSQRKVIGPQVIVEQRPFVPDPSPLPSDTEEAQETETEDDVSSIAPSGMPESVCSEDEMTRSDEESYTESEEEEEEWEPPNKTPKAKRNIVASPSPSPKGKTKANKSTSAANPKTPWTSKLAQDMDHLHLDDSTVILPRRYKAAVTDEEDSEEDGDVLVKKKKRLILVSSRASCLLTYFSANSVNGPLQLKTILTSWHMLQRRKLPKLETSNVFEKKLMTSPYSLPIYHPNVLAHFSSQ
jgi:hypothetical protein